MNPLHKHAFYRTRVLLLTLLSALMACAFGGVGAGAAAAHDQLLSSSPAEGEQLQQAPEAAELTFSGQISSIGAEIALRDANSQQIALPSTPSVEGKRATQALPRLAAGQYALDWRVVSEDGHPVSGTITFNIDPGETAEAENAQQATQLTSAVHPEGSGAPDAPGDSGEQGSTGLPIWAMALIGGLAGGLVVYLINRRRRKRS